MTGLLERTAIEYTYTFDIDVQIKLGNSHYPGFHESIEMAINEFDGVECIHITNHTVVFVIDIRLIETSYTDKASHVWTCINNLVKEFFIHDKR